MRLRYYAVVLLIVILASLPSMVVGQTNERTGRSDGLQFSDFAAPNDMKQVEARNLNALLSKWTGK